MCNNNCGLFGGCNSCTWILIIILVLVCCCGLGDNNGCGCGGCNNCAC